MRYRKVDPVTPFVMSGLKKLIQELHRRSLWQVLGIYLAGGWVVLQLVDTLAGALNLPEWAPPLALFLLIIGLPVVLATAFVQLGVGPRGADRVLADAPSDGTPPGEASIEGSEAPERRGVPTAAHRLLTWRNAVAGGTVAFALWGIAAAGWLLLGPGYQGSRRSGSERPSVAVLPFANESAAGAEDAAFFANGLHDEVITRLHKVGGLRVISRTSVMQYRDAVRNVPEIGEELGAGAVVEGGVQRAGDRVRLNIQLIDVATDDHLWAETYEERLTADNIFAIQADIAQQITSRLQSELTPEERVLVEDRPTENLEAYEFFLRGIEPQEDRYSESDLLFAAQMFNEAVRLDPGFAVAWARLAEAQIELFWFYDRTAERRVLARQAVERARSLAPDHPEVLHAVGQYYYHIELDYERALRELELALDRVPSDSRVLMSLGAARRRMGLLEAGTEDIRRAFDLDPNSARIALNLGASYQMLRDDDLAARSLARATELSPRWARAVGYAALHSLYQSADGEAAITQLRAAETAGLRPSDDPFLTLAWIRVLVQRREYDEVIQRIDSGAWGLVDGQFSYLPPSLIKAQVLQLKGDPGPAAREFEAAVRVLEQAAADAPDDERVHSSLGLAYAALGRRDDAMRAGERAIELMPRSRDLFRAVYREDDLARIYAAVGEEDRAIDAFSALLVAPTYLRAAFLRLDPRLERLRANPRFMELLDQN
jgi:TolB-like protein/Flp pilus assembly protein TadD